ncbi:MAG: type II secretion system F family protein [Candidatus Omnitrophica bacterium]|nr:type II secretion system F family protein [Candidatus Omnitrophota bacterium]
MIYEYRAKAGPNEIKKGTIEAESEKEAIEKISQMGFIPIQLSEYTASIQQPKAVSQTKKRGKIRSREITIFSRQLASLIKSGVPILDGLNIISEQSENQYFKEVLKDVYKSIKDGATLSFSLGQYPEAFSFLYIAMIRVGEDSGALPQVLLSIAEYRAKQEEMLSRIRMAMAYPILMAIVGIATVVFMLTFVIPRLTRIFVNMGQDLPMPTRILISISGALRQWWIWGIICFVILIIRRQVRKKSAKLSLSILKLRLPVFGKLVLKAELSRFTRTLALLIKNGIPILRGLEIAIAVIDNEIIKNQLRQSIKELEQGGSFGKSLKQSKIFPVFLTNLITVGEESGKLEEALSEVSSAYERDTDESIKTMASLLEPLMILVMGLVVGFVVIAMLLPIFEINMVVR